MRILVTGGAGFIGSHLVDLLVDGGHDVRVLDALLPIAHRAQPDYLNPGAEYLVADLADPAALATAVHGVDAVSHQAAMVGLGTDFGDVPDYVSHNDLGTARLLAALRARRFTGRLVLASSMVVYGEGRYTCPDHGLVAPAPRAVSDLRAGDFEPRCRLCASALTPSPVPEDAPPDPRSVYSATKLHQEHLCAAFARESSAGVIALRYHNVYGPRMPRDTPYAGVASIFASALARGEAPRVFEDGGQRRDFVHVRDVARANHVALTGPELEPGALHAFNVASGRPRSVLDMARALAAAQAGHAPSPVVTGQFRLGDVRHVFASAERAAATLGFRARVQFAAGMLEFAGAALR
ncbi:MAG: NAD-dependent epimerase/dehydratase family protein [Solirubrobacteraceae bacterium]